MTGRYRDQMVEGRSFDEIVIQFQRYKPATAHFVAWLRDSKYAFGLFAITSLDELVIGQSPEFSLYRNVIRIRETGDNLFRITFVESETSTSERQFKQSELIPAFERLLASLHWFE